MLLDSGVSNQKRVGQSEINHLPIKSLIMPTECTFDLVDSNTMAAKRWSNSEDSSPHRVIALHGWLDNSASFDFLIPYLKNVDILALDLAGHGRSYHRSYMGAYNIWQDLTDILMVADLLGWDRFSLLGHSRGAMIASVLCGTFPKRVERAALIEAVLPEPSASTNFPDQLAKSIRQSFSVKNKKINMYDSEQSAISARQNGMFVVSESAAQALAVRGLRQHEEGVYWGSDPKLFIPSEVKLSLEDFDELVRRFPSQAKVILGREGFLRGAPHSIRWLEQQENMDVSMVSGNHHLHMSADIKEIIHVAELINAYFV